MHYKKLTSLEWLLHNNSLLQFIFNRGPTTADAGTLLELSRLSLGECRAKANRGRASKWLLLWSEWADQANHRTEDAG